MTRRRVVSILGAAVAAVAMVFLGATSASAHGEKAQEGFVRMEAVSWWDVQFSKSSLKQGDQMTITGTAKILETWPSNMSGGHPSICYFTVVEPGARFVLVDRTINGAETPQSFFCHKGGIYDFSMTLRARDAGSWHVHPAVAVEQAGTLIGPGQWINIDSTPGGFTYPLNLLNGGTIDLESYGTWLILGFSALTLVLGLWWMIYWTVPKRTVTRLAVSNQLPLNQDGGEAVGLITRKDHRHMAIITLVTILLLAVGFGYQALAYPGKIPQQTDWSTPPALPVVSDFAKAIATDATYDPGSHVLTIKNHVTNMGKTPVTLAAFRTAYLAFVNPTAGSFAESGDYVHQLSRISPSEEIQPGQTTDVTLTIPGTVLEQEEMLPIGKAQLQVAGVVELRDSNGDRNFSTVETALNPTRT
jgi:methane/ammonia monooxygenase subunit B